MDAEQVTDVTDESVRKAPKGFWVLAGKGYARLGNGRYYPKLPYTLLESMSSVGEWP